MKHVAAAAGVSVMTVSLALRRARSFPVATRERVLAGAARHGYRLEVFRLGGTGPSKERLARVLPARGIRGVGSASRVAREGRGKRLSFTRSAVCAGLVQAGRCPGEEGRSGSWLLPTSWDHFAVPTEPVALATGFGAGFTPTSIASPS
jgi:hypothetical protein